MADSPSVSEQFGRFRSLAARLDDLDLRVLNAGTPSEEEIAQAVEDYLIANPVTEVDEVVSVGLAMSPFAVTAFGGTVDPGVSVNVAALSAAPVGATMLLWSGNDSEVADGTGIYEHAGGGVFNYAADQPLTAVDGSDPGRLLFFVNSDLSFFGASPPRSSLYAAQLVGGGVTPTYLPVGGSAAAFLNSATVVADLTIAFDVDGVLSVEDPNPTALGQVVAIINQSANPTWNGVYLGTTTDPNNPATYTPLQRIRSIPSTGIIVTDGLVQNAGEFSPIPYGGYVLGTPFSANGSGTPTVGTWRIIVEPSDSPDLSNYVTDDDPRLTDNRAPDPHVSTHLPGGDDPIDPAALGIHNPRFRQVEFGGIADDELDDFEIGESRFYSLTLAPLYAITLARCGEMGARIRVYTDSVRQTADEARPFATPPTGDHGVILDVEVAASAKLDITPAVIGFTAGAGYDVHPNGSTVYVTVTNNSGAPITPSVAAILAWVDLHDGVDGTPLGGGNDES